MTPRRWTRWVACSPRNSTYNRWSSSVSTQKRSVATMPCAWAARNCRQLGPSRRRSCIVTGSTKGLGYAIASHLVASGYEVIGVARSRPHDWIGADFIEADLSTEAGVGLVVEKTRPDSLGVFRHARGGYEIGHVHTIPFCPLLDWSNLLRRRRAVRGPRHGIARLLRRCNRKGHKQQS